jgi:hypothetical protein
LGVLTNRRKISPFRSKEVNRMKIMLFCNGKGLVCGSDPKRIVCPAAGLLRIGSAEIRVPEQENAVMPMLFQGVTGRFEASFEADAGQTYELAPVTVHNGWILPPSPIEAEVAELRAGTEDAAKRIEALERLFDTNGLNFII